MAPILVLKDVVKRYGPAGAEAAEIDVLKGVSLEVAAGCSVAIAGPSGSGKSTLLNLIGLLDRPTRGRIVLCGEDTAALSDRQLAQRRSRDIGFVFQDHHLLPQCTALENVLLPTLAGHAEATPRQAEQRARRLLQTVGLQERLEHRPGQLSGGERQRVALARALINRPRILLADEPTGSLDAKASDQIAEQLLQLNAAEQLTMILVTHARELASRMSKLFQLHDGQLTAC